MSKIDCTNCQLKDLSVCKSWRKFRIESCRSAAGNRSYDRDAMLFETGDKPGLVGILRSGYLRKERMSADGERTLVDLVFPGDIVGSFPGREVNYSLEAATESDLCLLDVSTARQVLNESAEFRRGVVEDMNRQLDRQLTLVWLRGAMTGRERILAFFVLAAQTMPCEESSGGGLVVTIPVSRKDWADLCNTTVESISRRIGELSAAGLLESLGNNRYLINDSRELRRQAGLEPDAFRHMCAMTAWRVMSPSANVDREPQMVVPFRGSASTGVRARQACAKVLA